MSVKQKTEDARGMALWYITEYLEKNLGYRRSDFIKWFAVDKSEKTIRRYINGESAMKTWKFVEFWKLVENAVQEHLKNQPQFAAIWEQEKAEQEEKCRGFFLDLSAPERSGGFQEYAQNKRDLLTKIQPIYEALDESTQYSLQRNFLALANVTAEDCVLLAHTMTRTKEDKEALKAAMLQGNTVNIGTMLDYLQSEEVRCWVNLKNQDYANQARNSTGNWERFSEKCEALTPWQFAHVSLLIETILLLALDNWNPGTNGIEDKLPTVEDIELLLLFKYCLAPDERGRYIESE